MNTTARILLVGLGMAWACLPPSAAASPRRIPTSWLSAAVVRQAEDDAQDEHAEARDLISRARQAMKEGDLDVAEKLVAEAEALDVSYSRLHFGDTPKKARRDLDKLKKRQSGKKETLADRFKFFGEDEANEAPVEDPFTAHQDEVSEPKARDNDAPRPTSPAPPSLEDPFAGQMVQAGRRQLWNGETLPKDGKSLLLDARRAMAYGDMNRAKLYLDQATALKLNYELTDDSPAKVQATWSRLQELQGRDPSTRTTEAYRREYAGVLLEQAEAMLQWNELDEAERLCTVAGTQKVSYGPFDVKPDSILERITAARTGKPATGLTSVPGEPPRLQPVSAGVPMPGAEGDASKQQVVDLIQKSRTALAAKDLETAERLARQAESIRVPDNAFVQGEDRPWLLLLDIQKARMNRARDAQPAVFDPAKDASRNVAAQATSPFEEGEPTPADQPTDLPETEPSGTSLPTPPGEGPGSALFQQGEDALRARDVTRAAQLFRQAAAYKDEFDPLTWQRLQDHLQLLAAPANPAAAGAANPAQDAVARQQLAARQVAAELARLEAESNRLMETDPRRGREVLVTAGQMVENSGVEPAVRDQLLRRVQRGLTQVDQYIANNQGRIELMDQNRAIKTEIDRETSVRVEVDQKLAKMVNEFNQLMDERRYAEAELVAKQCQELAPNSPLAIQLRTQVRQTRSLVNQVNFQEDRDAGFLASLDGAQMSSVPFDDSVPFRFGDPKKWEELTNRRQSLDARTRMRSEKDLQIENKLKTPVSLSFQNRPLAEVIDYLGKVGQVNVHLNSQGLADAGVTSDTPVTIDLKDEISIKSALNLILEPLNLTYVIKNEVLNITSEDQKDGNLYSVAYPVADLVIGIPNFIPNSRMGLAGALHDAYGFSGGGGIGGFAGHNPISIVASRNGAASNATISPAVLASVGASEGAAMHTGSTAVPQGSAGPGGIGGGVQPDFDSLIELITSTIQPTSWTDVGGTGAIQEFESNLTLVISQTQDVHEEIADLLEQLRRLQDLQVTIEVQFITLSEQFFERIGVDFDFDLDDDIDKPFQVFGEPAGEPAQIGANPPRDTQDRDHGPTNTVGLDPASGNFTSDLDVPFAQGSFPLAVPQFGGFAPGAGATLGFAILSDIEARFIMEASQGDRRSNIMQAPKVTLFNGQQAFVSDQSQSPFVISVIPVVGDFAAAQQPVIVVLNEGTHMSVQAVVSSDRRFVRMTLVPFFSQIGDVDTFTFTGETSTTEDSASEGPDDDTTSRENSRTTTTAGTTVQLPTFSFTTVTTTVSVPDGGTVLLGGIKRMSEGRNEFGVPLLSKVPYVNRLFKNVGIGHETQTLMMMVTPRIIIQEEEEALLGVPQAGAPAQP